MKLNARFDSHMSGIKKIQIVIFVAVAVIAVYFLMGGRMPGTGLQECKGTTGIYREYDYWAENYQRYSVPDDPACMGE